MEEEERREVKQIKSSLELVVLLELLLLLERWGLSVSILLIFFQLFVYWDMGEQCKIKDF